jgi:hypothetical protein
MINSKLQQRIESLRHQIKEQRSWGNNKVADLLAGDLQQLQREQRNCITARL